MFTANSLKGTHENIGSVSAQLDWRGMTPFGELSGVFPFTFPEDLDNRIVNFSAGKFEQVSSIDLCGCLHSQFYSVIQNPHSLLDETSHVDFRPHKSQATTSGLPVYRYSTHMSQGGVVVPEPILKY